MKRRRNAQGSGRSPTRSPTRSPPPEREQDGDPEEMLAQVLEQIDQVRTGTHIDIARKKEQLGSDMERKIAASDRYRKLQIKNINELYDFEIEEAKTRFEVSYLPFDSKLEEFQLT
jgi:hypothetical protein